MTASKSVYGIAPENIPEQLRQAAQWLCWRGVWDEEKEKLNKVPKMTDGTAGSSTNATTWTTFEAALGAVGDKGLDGIGFAGMERTPYVGIDVDNCIDPETGEISPYAMKLVRDFDSYTERTVSGTGLRIWVEAEKAPGSWCGSKNEARELEVYSQGRFFTVTGLHLDGTPRTIERRQEALDAFMEREAPPEKPKPDKAAYNGSSEYRLDLNEFLQEHGVTVLGPRNDQSSERAYAIVCPWSREHTGGDTSGTRVGQFPGGALWFKCDHAHCDGRVWEHFRQELDPGAYRRGRITFKNSGIRTDKTAEGQRPNGNAARGQGQPTHDELRDRYIAANGDFSYGLGEWRAYGGGVWPPVPELTIKRGICETIEAAKPEGIKPTNALLTSVTELTRVRVAVPDEAWDADPDILVCNNGALRISTRELEPHRREHYATSAVPYDYDPASVPVVWNYFLKGAVPAARDFLQEFAGYALTTEMGYELAVWLFGPPASGKSTFLAGLQAMLGHRAGVLGLAEIERNRFALAGLPGKTLVAASEQPSSYLASTNVLNAIISGEPLQVERKYRDPVTVLPRCKIAWAMNELPRVGDANSGLFRRVKVVKFPQVPANERDPRIKRGIESEGAGILNWALEGLDRLQRRGEFDVPDGVEEATAQFRETNDVPALFVADRCVKEPDASEKAGTLYGEYRDWCEDNGHRPQSSTRLADDWQRLGFERYRSKGTTRYKGIRLRMAADE